MTNDEKLFLMLKLLLEPIEVSEQLGRVSCPHNKYPRVTEVELNKVADDGCGVFGAIGKCSECGKVYYWIRKDDIEGAKEARQRFLKAHANDIERMRNGNY